jgi:hypothetical protein
MKVLSLLLPLLAAGCGGSNGTETPTQPTGSVIETFTGTTQMTTATSCSNSGHPFSTGDGEIVITIAQASDGGPLAVQVCHPTAVNHANECTVPPFARVAVGGTHRATLRGGRSQVLVLYPASCGAPNAAPTGVINYTAMLEHPR